jgi:hypothetical protein
MPLIGEIADQFRADFRFVQPASRVYSELTPHVRELLFCNNQAYLQALAEVLGITLELLPNPSEILVGSTS